MSEDKANRVKELEVKQAEADKVNSERDGVGLRVRVGQTRGKNPVVVTWEAFDESKPETLPTEASQFMEITGINDKGTLLSYWIAGYNDAAYTAASDPLAEYVEDSWPSDAQTQFRLVVRNYSRGTGVSLEDAVSLIKPGFVKQFTK
jgi:hypothetical protein